MWSVLGRMTDGNWVTTSYYPWRGTIHHDVYAEYHIVNRSVNFAPANILEYSDSESHNLLPARAWSSQGIWENLLYKKLLKTYKMALPKLEQYYLNNYGLDKYSKDSPKILSYIVNAFVFDQDITKSVAFQIIYQADGDFNKLKTLCNNTEMEKKDWNELFGRAIIENFEADALKWILDSGADINSKSFDETPLMKAANKRDILKFLLDHGADTEISNTFGKTPIFYAIQFGDHSEVKILVDAGANINKPFYNIEQVQENTMVEQVVDFTPLVYAMRYADKYLIDYLQNQGATLGNAPIERILLWVREGKLDL